MSACSRCDANQWQCRCWETEAAKYRHKDITGQIRLEELRDEMYGVGGSASRRERDG